MAKRYFYIPFALRSLEGLHLLIDNYFQEFPEAQAMIIDTTSEHLGLVRVFAESNPEAEGWSGWYANDPDDLSAEITKEKNETKNS